ncbi:MAG: hypothetical protein JWM02_1563 [Frankiales bacterium]|nr:hypothetical protein [Frankiales bacterium]
MAGDKHTVVTTAARSGTDDRKLRQRRYLLTQVVRMACFVLAVTLPVPLWGKLLLIVGAFALPWLGVVAANGGPTVERASRPDAIVDHVEEGAPLTLDPHRTIDHE